MAQGKIDNYSLEAECLSKEVAYHRVLEASKKKYIEPLVIYYPTLTKTI